MCTDRQRVEILAWNALQRRKGHWGYVCVCVCVCVCVRVTLPLCVSGPICWFSSQSLSLMCCCFLLPNRAVVLNWLCLPLNGLGFNGVIDQASTNQYILPHQRLQREKTQAQNRLYILPSKGLRSNNFISNKCCVVSWKSNGCWKFSFATQE